VTDVRVRFWPETVIRRLLAAARYDSLTLSHLWQRAGYRREGTMCCQWSWNALLLALVACSSLGSEQELAQPPATLPTPPQVAKPAAPAEVRSQRWEFGISIRAVNGPCAGILGTFPVPAEWPEQQVKVISEQITNVVRHSYRESDGLKQMVFEVPQLGTGVAATCYITFEITKQPQVPPAETSSLVIPKDVPREVRKYLSPSPLIESTSAKVRSLAKEWTAGKETAWEQVQEIAAGVREKIRYEQESKNIFRGAAGALKDGKADKEDLTATFVAICRAAKVPARIVWALDYCYAEFYLSDADGKGAWYPCVVHDNVELGAMKDVRPILEKGDNFRVPEDKAPQRFVREFLSVKGGGTKPSVEFRRMRVD
jgi:Transglutaminase-like superfamily